MNKSEGVAFCDYILAHWPSSFSVTTRTAEIYAKQLHDVSLRDAELAIDLIVNRDTGSFAPSIGAIREALRQVKNPDAPTVEEEFAEVIKLASRSDNWSWAKTQLSPSVARAAQAIGWRRFCYDSYDTHPFLFKSFKEALENVQDSAEVAETTARITELPESVRNLLANAGNGQRKLT